MERAEDKKEMLRQRTKRFASVVIRFYCELPKNRTECQVIGKQLLRSGTSVAANYREASRARSDAEFVSKIELCALRRLMKPYYGLNSFAMTVE